MGKIKKNRLSNRLNLNPLGMSQNSINIDKDNFSNESFIGSIRDQLQNCNVEEKLNGLQSLAVLSANKDKVDAICCTDIIRIAAPLLFEKDDSLCNAASGALRNFSVCGPEICEHLVDQDVLTPLVALLSKYFNNEAWKPTFDASMNGQLDLKSDSFLQAINLLWNLCESSSLALETFNQSHLLEKIIRCLDFNEFGVEIAISVSQCLLVVSDNNPHSWSIFNNHISELLSLLNLSRINGGYEFHYLSTLAAGILSNVPALAATFLQNILSTLSQTLNIDHSNALLETMKSVTMCQKQSVHISELDETMEDESEYASSIRRRRQDLPTEVEIAMKKLQYLLDAQRLAAEIITNVCSSEEDEWEDNDDLGSSDNECVLDYDTMKDVDENVKNSEKLSIDVLQNLKLFGISEKLWQRRQSLSSDIIQVVRETNAELLIKVKRLRISTLICLQNMCTTMSCEDFGGAANIYAMWVELGQQVFKGPKDPDVLEPSTSLMRSALHHLKNNPELFNQMTESDLDLILEGVNRSAVSEIRANWLRMLGTLGCLLPEYLVKKIILFILEACGNEQDVWTLSEAIDALMDIFAINDWPQIIIDLDLCKNIKNLEKSFKSKIRQQRKDLNERYPAVHTVRLNLLRFVKYIENESLKFNAKL